MSLRDLTHADNYFLGRYLCDNKLQVRSEGHVKNEGPKNAGSVYSTQWGSQRQCDDALVLASGTEVEMRAKLRKEQNPSQPKAKRQKKNARGKKVARMLATVEVDSATGFTACASSNPVSLPMLATAQTSEAVVPAARTNADVSFPDVLTALAPVAVAPAAITHVVVALSNVVPTTATVAPAAVTRVDVPTSLAPATVTHADYAPNTDVSTPEVSTTLASETPARWPSFCMARPR